VLANGLLNEVLARAPEPARPAGRARRYVLAGACVAALLASNGLLEVQVRKQWLAYLGIDRPLFVDKHRSWWNARCASPSCSSPTRWSR
jgi:hypothetical protein